MLPTPRASDGTKGSPGQRDSHGNLTLPSAAIHVATLPTPTVSDQRGPGRRAGGDNLRTTITDLATATTPDQARWGRYTHAIIRWQALLGRPAPAPTQPGRYGKPVLAPPFVEWLMGLPQGWVCGLDLPRTVALRLLGNGVVPQQATTALRTLLILHAQADAAWPALSAAAAAASNPAVPRQRRPSLLQPRRPMDPR